MTYRSSCNFEAVHSLKSLLGICKHTVPRRAVTGQQSVKVCEETNVCILNKAITLGLLGNVVKMQINGINRSERLEDLTNIVLAQGER